MEFLEHLVEQCPPTIVTRMKSMAASFAAAGLVFSACATMVQVNGHEIFEPTWPVVQKHIAERVRFDLRCEEPPTMTLLAATRGFPTVVGVYGCNKTATYVRAIDGYNQPTPWVLNAANVQQ